MLLAGSVAFGAVIGWWLVRPPVRPVLIAVSAALVAATAVTGWLVGGDDAGPAAVVGTAMGAAAHGAFRRMVRWSLQREG